MAEQSFRHIPMADVQKSLWLSSEACNNIGNIGPVLLDFHNDILPIKHSIKRFTVWNLSYHNGSGSRRLVVPVSYLDLILSFLRRVNLSRSDDKIFATFRHIGKHLPMPSVVLYLCVTYDKCIVHVEHILLRSEIQQCSV